MDSYQYFAAEKLNIEPDVTNFFLWIYAALFIALLVLIGKDMASSYIKMRRDKAESDKDLRFDSKESKLIRGSRELDIPENSLEYFVCKLVFESPTEYQSDTDVLEAAGRGSDSFEMRPVYQAVKRLNKKSMKSLELKSDLFKRGKEKTGLNEIERII